MNNKIKNALAVLVVLVTATAAAYGARALAADKLPKCSKTLCRSVGCSADTLCASGTTVKTCADICNNH
jgi:hypothetical protein